MSDLHWMGATELAGAIAARRLSPVEVVRYFLDRIDRYDEQLKSYLSVFGDAALAAARQAEAAVIRGRALGPLHGVPIPVKDLLDVAGTPTTAGSAFLSEPATADSTVVSRLRAAGAIILGKLNLHEFAYGPEGINVHHGTPLNPWDRETPRLPGGSSSGSAVAVAAGLAPAAIGSDTGGSIRIPAACCGVVGLKPTYGRVSRAGSIPLSWSLDHFGPLARSASDAGAILWAIAGQDPADPTTSFAPAPESGRVAIATAPRWRLGLLTQFLEQADGEVQSAMRRAADDLAALGCIVEPVRLETARFAEAVSVAITGAEALAFHEPLLRRHAAHYAADVRQRLLTGRFLSAGDYVNAQRARALIRNEVNEALTRFDCLLAPTVPTSAPEVNAAQVTLAGESVPTRRSLLLFTRLANVSGHPAIAVPCGFSPTGMPLSLQLIGRAYDEMTLICIAQAYEQATPWQRHPEGF